MIDKQKKGLFTNWRITIHAISLFIFVFLAFSHHVILYSISNTIYVVLLFITFFLAILSKGHIIIDRRSICWLWLGAAGAMIYSFYFVSSRDASAQVDVAILLIGMLFCMFTMYKGSDYLVSLKMIAFIGAVHSLGILTAYFMPSVHRALVSFLPTQMAQLTLASPSRGFTVNSGFSAAFISVGFLALVSLTRKKLLHVIFLIALLFTSKRAHPLFLGMVMIFCYLLPVRGLKQIRRYWIMFLLFSGSILVFLAFKDLLAIIPFFASIIETIDGLILGEDISSSRTDLTAWAWQVFSENPIFGIGWGDYRTSIIGNVTRIKELDTHNIYMQLLSESGLVGFICFMLPMSQFWIKAKNAFCICTQNEDVFSTEWKSVTKFSFAFQTFFLLYGLTGNPLYDPNWQIMYMIACGMTLSYIYNAKKRGINI